MKDRQEKLFEKVSGFQHWSFIVMSIIVAYHIVTPESVGGIIMMIILFFPIFLFSHKVIDLITVE